MNRMEFIKELEYLLQDVPEEEREDAVGYYRDYLEEAGDEGEEQAILEFGSPERVAAIIRSDLDGNLEEGGEFTDAGYQDERFRDPNYQVVKRKDLPDVRENLEQEHSSEEREDYAHETWHSADENKRKGCGEDIRGNERKRRDLEDRIWFKRLLKVGLFLLILGIAAPVILGLGGSVLGTLALVLCVVAGIFFCVGVLTILACVGAVITLVMGAGMLFVRPSAGVLILGGGILILGLALIGVALSVVIYGTWIPSGIRLIVNTISNLLHRGRRRA